MLMKCVLFLFTVFLFSRRSDANENDKFFRNDYKYVKETESFYKIHTLPKTWEDAKIYCEREGAFLFYPEDVDEAEVIISHWNATQPFISWIYIGVAAWNVPEVFETIDGRSISDVYDHWGSGEPNNVGGVEDCVIMRMDGTLNDDSCKRRNRFICKKSLATLQWNTHCDMPDPNYKYHSAMDRCYKFHLSPKNWTDAYAICRAEQSYLAIINSEAEANLLVNITANAPKEGIKGNYLSGGIHLGFRNRDGWITTAGVPLHLSGYNDWSYAQPDGGENESCGSMFYDGKLNDIGCHQRMFFICEHEVKAQ